MQKNYRALKTQRTTNKTQTTKNCPNKSTQKAVFFKDRDKVCICLVDKGRPNVFFYKQHVLIIYIYYVYSYPENIRAYL